MRKAHPISEQIGIKAVFLLIITCALIIAAGLFSCAYAKDADNGGSYDIGSDNIDIDDNDITCTITGSTGEHHVKVKSNKTGAVINLSGASIDLSGKGDPCIKIEENAEATVNVTGSCTLKGGRDSGAGQNNGHAAIYVHKNAELTLNVNGKMYVYGGDGGENRGAAAIGGDDDQDSGTITINVGDGGELYCEGGDGAAAIGGGDGYSANKPITITTKGSGKLTAKAISKGSGGGAGIGGGDGGSTNSTITIDMEGSGNITAEGSSGGAGIGGGKNHGCGTISITMAGSTSINATGHNDAAGIGGGDDGSVPDIYIFGSTVSDSDRTKTNTASVTAAGASGGAGIGGGSDGHVDGIHIRDIETLNVTGGADAPGIGAGHHDGEGDGGNCGTILIQRVSKINASGGSDAAGIGGSHTGTVGTLTIDAQDSEINASGGAAGIGGGDDGSIGNITISNINKSITATAGDNGAGIGGCNAKNGDICLDIKGGSVTAKGGYNGAGIGGGDDVSGSILISGWGSIDATGGFDAAAIGGGEGKDCGSISILGDSAHHDITNDEIRAGSFDGKSFALKIDARACEEDRHVSAYYAPNIGGKHSGAIKIENADVNCYYPEYAAMYGASIGCGNGGSVTSDSDDMSDITISHSRLTQHGSRASYNAYAPMVGEGYDGKVSTIELDNVHSYGPSIGGAAWGGGDISSINITNSNIFADAVDTASVVSVNKLKYADPVAGIGSGKDASIGSITISDSKINAYGKNGGAGIGSGGFYMGNAGVDNMFDTGGKCGSITISNSEVEARGAMGGAGIGGGQMTSVTGTISISGSSVKASAVDTSYSKAAGAGIGGGGVAGCSDISIKDSTVDASTVNASAGIGSGGVMDANFFGGILETFWDAEVGNIDIENSTVTATGGTNGAGIGSGWGSQQDGSKHISITDSTVTAKGGSYAAGIGGGNNSEFERGGSISNVSITGKSRVEATGGDEAAGIGGGSQGEIHGCTIELDETTEDGENGKKVPKYYVKAWGGAGAAGIGSGASHATDLSGMFEGAHIAEKITINKGFVYARGGGDKQLSNVNGDYWIGAGAGIGGGGRAGIKELKIYGGIIKAETQSSTVVPGVEKQTRQACGLGHGGGYAPWAYADTDCTSISLYGGTVDGIICDQATKYVTGGSVKDNMGGDHPDDPKTQGSDGKKVFRNTLNIENELLAGSPVDFMGSTYYPVSLEKTSLSGYGQWAKDKKNVYAIGRGDKPELSQLFLWFKPGDANASYADIGGYGDGKTRHYYGTTNDKDNTNLLKQGSQIDIKPYPEDSEPTAEDEFTLCVSRTAGDPINGDTQFEYNISGDSDAVFVKEEHQQNGTRLVTVKPAKTGELIVEAKLGDGDDVYWGASAKYSGTVGAKKAEIVINKDPSKVYDGQPASVSTDPASGDDTPDISVDPEAARGSITVRYFDSAGNELKDEAGNPKAPVEPGEYTADVSVEAGADGAGAAWSANTESCSFTISKYKSHIAVIKPDKIVFTYDLGGQPVQAEYEVAALNTPDGIQPALKYENDGGSVSCEWAKMKDDGSYAVINGAPSEAGEYRMKLTADETSHYTAAERTFYFRVADQLETDLSVTMQSKTYDGEAAAAPDIQTNRRESELQTVYFKKDGNDWTELTGAPADAGEYKVRVTAPENRYFRGAESEQEFSIGKRAVLLDVSASRAYGDDGQPTEGATVRIDVINGVEAMADHVKVKISVKTSAGNVITRETTVTGPDSSGKMYAEVTFDNVGAGAYTVSAEIPDNELNCESYNREEEFDKDLREYNVDVKESSVALDEGVFELKVKVTDPLGLEDDYSLEYSVEDGSDLGDEFRENVVTTAGKTRLKVTGAGKALVKVTVTPNEETPVHAVSEGYAVITVRKGSFDIAVTADDKVYDGHSQRVKTELVYKGDYPVSYSGSIVIRHYDAFAPESEVSEMIGSDPVDAGAYRALAYAPEDDNFESSLAGDRYEITPAKLKITTGSASKAYDGRPLTCDEAAVSGLVNGEKTVIKTTGSQTEIGSSLNTYTVTWAGDAPDKATAKESNYMIDGETLGKLTVIDPALLYAFTEGAGSSWKKGSGKELKFTVERSIDNEAAFSHFRYIKVDGKKVSSSNYSTKSGSVKLSLKAKYLQKLKNGKHTITAVFDDGEAGTEFTVAATDGSGDDDGRGRRGVATGDESMALLWAGVMITSMMLLVCLMIKRRRKA